MSRPLPWDRLTDRFPKPLKFETALKNGGLDYDVQLADLNIDVNGSAYPVTGHSAVIRTDTHDVLGVVGDAYTPVSNRTALSVVDEIGKVDYAWETHGGTRAGMAIHLDSLTIADFEELDLWLEVSTGHDGKYALQYRPVILQLVCLNQLPPAVGELFGKMRHRVIHTFSAEDKASSAAAAIEMAEKTLANAGSAIEMLLDLPLNDEDCEGLLATAGRATELSKDARIRVHDQIMSLHASSDTLDDNVRHTGWGLMHAATEYWTHTRAHRSQSSAWAACNAPRGAGKLFCNKLTGALHAMAK